MLIIWIFFVVSLLLFLIASGRLLVFLCLLFSKPLKATVTDINFTTYPMRLTTGNAQYEVLIRYTYRISNESYVGVDIDRSSKLEKTEALKDVYKVGSEASIKVLKAFPSISYIFIDIRKILLLFFLCVFSGVMSVWIYFFL